MRLHDALDYRAREFPDQDFARQGARRLSYGEAAAAANQTAHALIEHGVGEGDRVAILAKNSLEYLLLYLGAAKAGAVTVPINYRLAPPEWRYILADSGARICFVGPEFVDGVNERRGDLATVEHALVVGGEPPAGWESYTDWTAAAPATAPDRRVTADHDAYQMYTSGTTGHPKGAVLTHRAVTANLVQIALACQGPPAERSLVVAPLFHAGTVPSTFSPIWWGGTVVIVEQFDPIEVVRLLDEEHIGFTVMVPAMLQACLDRVPDASERRFGHLRLIYYGSSPIAESTLRRAMGVFNCDFVQSYGMTEATQALTFLTPLDHRRALAADPCLLLSAGRPAPGTEVRIVDPTDAPLPNGSIGEVVACGPQLMNGYWNQPEATAETLRGGWLHTGDAGMMDDEGFLYIQDRIKDMIVSGGENVYPREVEDVLFLHPAVHDVAVIGVPEPRWGESVKAVVVLRPGATATAGELVSFCRGHLGGFKVPRSVDFVDALPRNASGKVLKRLLREPYWADVERRVAGA